jgi:hypothetical protein
MVIENLLKLIEKLNLKKLKEAIRKEIQAIDLLEIEKTGGTSDIKQIRNVIRENYTHNSLLGEIKSKASKSSLIDDSNDTPVETQSVLSNMWDNIKSSVSPKMKPVQLTELIDKVKSIESLKDLNEKETETLNTLVNKVTPDNLIENLKNYNDNLVFDSVITATVDNTIMKIQNENPGFNKQQLIEKLIQDNPVHKDIILEKVTTNMEQQLTIWENRLSEKDFKKIRKVLTVEDLKEREALSSNINIDKIKTLRSVNKSHSNLLQELKNKASNVDLKKEKSFDNTSSSTEHLDNTMDLFD